MYFISRISKYAGSLPIVFSSRYFCLKIEKSLPDYFADPKIHNLLRLITYNNPRSVHLPHFKKVLNDRILMLTDSELQAVQKFSSAFTHQRLQMPPVLPERNEVPPNSVIIKDPMLLGLLPRNYKLVFTDISSKETRATRLIVVREPDGTLRHATASERERMNLVYFPLPGRRMRVPLMFRDPYLKNLLDQGEYAYILDRACVQFEPNDAAFLRLCHTVYEHISARAWKPFSTHDNVPLNSINPLRRLRHTRYYGPLALYLICEFANPGSLVYEALSCQHYARLGWILRLITYLQPSAAFSTALVETQLPLPPPVELDANSITSDQTVGLLKAEEIENLLSYVQLFTDREPLTKDQKQVLLELTESARDGLAIGHPSSATG